MFTVPMGPLVTGASSSFSVDIASDEAANVFVAYKTGSIDRVVVSVAAITGTSPVYELTIEQTTGHVPNGTLVTAGASQTFTPTAGANTITLGTPASVTKGQIYAVRIKHSSGTIDGSNRANFHHQNININWYNSSRDVNRPCTSLNSRSTWSTSSDSACAFAPLYSDDAAENDSFCIITSTTKGFRNTGVTHLGCRFIAPANCDVIGANYSGSNTSTTGRTLKLLNLSDGELASQAQPDFGVSTSNNGNILFASPVSLTAGTEYRLVFEADTSNLISASVFQYASSDIRQACHADVYLTSKTGGVWTDETDYAPYLVPILSNFQSGGGGGGGGGGFQLVGGGGLVF